MPSAGPSRLGYIDWMRGLACLLMFQTHCYDSWLGPQARRSNFFMWSQLGGTLPAPLFLFLAGISFALVTDKLREKGMAPRQIARTTIWRGAEIFGLGLLFRAQEYLIAFPWAPWTDLFRVDILNTIGVSMMLMGVVCWTVLSRSSSRAALISTAVGTAACISLLTPMLWTSWRPHWLPWPIESYINGVHNLKQPQPWLFPIFPWTAFAFVGLAAGFVILSGWGRKHQSKILLAAGATGIALAGAAHWLDTSPVQIYPVYDFWHTSPNFFLIRVGILLVILSAVYAWCRWGAGQWGFSPMVQLGQTSLLVYWVHIEFVYGRFSILPKRVNDVRTATFGLLAIFLAMLLLSIVRTKLKRRREQSQRAAPTPAAAEHLQTRPV